MTQPDATSPRATVLRIVRDLRERIKRSPGLAADLPLSDEGLAIVEAALSETRDMVSVPRDTLKRWHEAIGPFWFTSGGEDGDYNNDGVIETSREIEELLK